MSSEVLKKGINPGVSNAQYHADKRFISSTGVKLILKDLPRFHREYVLGEKSENEWKPAFSLGSLVHTKILEPHLESKEYVVLPETVLRRRGAEFDAVMADPRNQGKTPILPREQALAEELHFLYETHEVAVDLIKGGGEPEVSLVTELDGIDVKVRADWINVEEGYIVDVKTSSSPVDRIGAIDACEKYDYFLSAALYKMAFEKHYGKKFDFYWMFLGKFDKQCHVYKLSDKSFERGKLQIEQAFQRYRKALETDTWDGYVIEEI